MLDVLVPAPRSDFGLTPPASTDNTARQVMRKRLREGSMDDKEIEIALIEAKPSMEILGPQAANQQVDRVLAESLRRGIGIEGELAQLLPGERIEIDRKNPLSCPAWRPFAGGCAAVVFGGRRGMFIDR